MTVDYGNNHNTDSENSVFFKKFYLYLEIDFHFRRLRGVDLGFEKWSLPKNLQI